MRRTLVALTLVGTIILTTAAPAMAAPARVPATYPAAAERDFFARVNAERASRRLPALVRDHGLDAIARNWSVALGAKRKLSHRPALNVAVERQVTRAWTRLGENVGMGPNVTRLHQAFMASPPHRANVLGDYNRVGVGVVVDRKGTVWVTFNFMKAPAIKPAVRRAA